MLLLGDMGHSCRLSKQEDVLEVEIRDSDETCDVPIFSHRRRRRLQGTRCPAFSDRQVLLNWRGKTEA
jgi:hypothetical protein